VGGGGGTESIHDIVLSKEDDIKKYLKLDSARRGFMQDRFLAEEVTVEAFSGAEFSELGDFFTGRYDAGLTGDGVTLSRKGSVKGRPVTVVKGIRAAGNSLGVDYRVEGGEAAAGVRFAVEFNVILPCCDGPVCRYDAGPVPVPEAGLGTTGELREAKSISIIDALTKVRLSIEADTPATLWRFPVYTVSISEAGFEKIFQGSCVVFLFPMDTGGLDVGFDIRVEGHDVG